jgi:hypothetical protein
VTAPLAVRPGRRGSQAPARRSRTAHRALRRDSPPVSSRSRESTATRRTATTCPEHGAGNARRLRGRACGVRHPPFRSTADCGAARPRHRRTVRAELLQIRSSIRPRSRRWRGRTCLPRGRGFRAAVGGSSRRGRAHDRRRRGGCRNLSILRLATSFRADGDSVRPEFP